MSAALRVLIIEDSEDDALLLLRELRRDGWEPQSQRVDTPEAMTAALSAQEWDVVISDFIMPRFSGLEALRLLRQFQLDLPFIITSGKIGEETAVEAMRAGATDYVMKENLGRLVYAIRREMRDAQVRREFRQAEQALKEQRESHLRELEERVQARTAELQAVNEQLRCEIEERRRAEGELKVSLAEKVVLLKEVHHRVKNNLNIIYALLSMQLKNVKAESAAQALNESRNRIRSIALVHEKLYLSENLGRIPFRDYAQSLTQSLLQSYGNMDGAVTIAFDMQDITLPIDIALPCGLIVTELVSNALRHAFPNGRKGEIRLKLEPDGGMVALTVADNGVGMAGGMDFPDTLGLQLVQTLSRQIEARLELHRDKGTTFRLLIPVKTAVQEAAEARAAAEELPAK